MIRERTPKESSLFGLLLFLRGHGIKYDIEKIRQGINGKDVLTTEDLDLVLRRHLNVNVICKGTRIEDLNQLNMPLIVQLSNGEHRLLEKAEREQVAIRDPETKSLESLPLEDFMQSYSGISLFLPDKNGERVPEPVKNAVDPIQPEKKEPGVQETIDKDEPPENPPQPHNDSGIQCLVILLRMLQIPFSVDNLKHQVAKADGLNNSDLVYLAGAHLGLKAKSKKVKTSQLKNLPTPVIAELKDQRYCLIAKVEKDRIHIRNPQSSETEVQSLKEFHQVFNQVVVMVSDRPAEEKSLRYENFGLWWFIAAFAKNRMIFTQVIVSALIMQIFVMVTPLFTMIIIDKVLSASGTSTLEVLIIGLGIMAVFDYLVGFCRSNLLHLMSNRVDLTLVSDLFRHLVSLPMTFFTGKQTGDTISRMKEVESIRGFLTGSALTALIDFPFSLIFIAVMYFFSPLLCIIVAISIVLSVLIYGIAGPFLKARVKKKQEGTTDQQSFLFEIVTSIETIKSLSAESRIQKNWENQLVVNSENASRSERISSQINQLAAFLNKATIAICLWLGAVAVLDGEMTAGQLIAFNMLVGRVMGPAQRIAQIFQQLQQIKVSVERIREIFLTRAEPSLNTALVSLPSLKGSFELDKVSFRYTPDSLPVIEDVSLSIPAGQIVGIIGLSGSGKSTLMRLIQRLYIPTSGKILIDGINTAEINPEWFRKNIGVVLQDNILLNRSVRENIAFTDPSVSMEVIENAAVLSGADEFIRKLPKVYDTIVGERGYLLSAGQRQRIALARALVNNPRVIILDEATSALDYESEQMIQKNMGKICEGRTVFIVAHRFSTLRIANRIIALENGRIVEDGNIIELLKKRGLFARLFAMQNIMRPGQGNTS
jgi:subfamily B ATP-binding cassette protein HlyB/CyaB